MNQEDNILFSQYFYLRRDFKNNRKDFYDMTLKFLLNSKEFNESPIRIGIKTSVEILGIVVNLITPYSYNSKFSVMYSVSDGENYENRTMEGVLNFSVRNNVNIIMISNVSRFSEQGFIGSLELVENFTIENGSYVRYFDYGGTEHRGVEYINNRDFDKVEEFKENTVKKLMRSKIK